MSNLRIRFVFNHHTKTSSVGKGGSKGVENFSRYIVRQVAFAYSDGLYKKLQRDISRRIKGDIDKELAHMAKLFMSNVVGISGYNRGPTGNMTSLAPKTPGFTQSVSSATNIFGGWAKRSPKYLRWRGRNDYSSGGNPSWFRRNSPSVLDKLRAAGTWTGAYGGFVVGVHRHTTFNYNDTGARAFDNARLGGTKGGAGKVGVATIRVDAMSRITPAMLPAVGGGALNDFGANPRRSGLLLKLGQGVANRLGGDPQGNRVPFRPTIQPFLGFFLTRQLPNAVLGRVTQGLDGRLRENIGSAGTVDGAGKLAALRAAGRIPKR